MSLLSDFMISIRSYSEAISLIRAHKMGRIFFFSCFLYLFLIIISSSIMWYGLDYFIESLLSLSYIKSLSQWLSRYPWLLTITKIALYLSSIFYFISIFKYLFLAIASPLYAYLSEKTSEAVNNTSYPLNVAQLIKDIGRGVIISLKNMAKQFFLTMLLFILSFIPIVGLVSSFLIIILDCYYYGFSMLDYNCERNKMDVKQSSQLISSQKGLAIGNGLVMYLSLLIPFIGVMFIAPLSAVAASIAFYKKNPQTV